VWVGRSVGQSVEAAGTYVETCGQLALDVWTDEIWGEDEVKGAVWGERHDEAVKRKGGALFILKTTRLALDGDRVLCYPSS